MLKNKGGLIMIAIGLIVAASSLPSILQTVDYLNKSRFASGIVVNTAQEDYHNSHFSIPIVEFKTSDGQTEQFKSTKENSPQKYFVGDPVEVVYDPANPTKAEINVPIDIWSGPAVTIFFGLFFILVGIFSDKLPIKVRTNHSSN